MRYDRIGRQSPVSFARLCLCIFLAVLLTAASGLASVCFGAGTGFSDVHTWQWHAEAVAQARTEGILEGYPDGTFRPDRFVTCGEFLRMSIPEAPKTSAAHWADGYYREGLHRELYTVRDIGETALDRPIARQYMALVYSRLMEESEGIQIARTEGSAVPPAPFSDVAETSAYEYPIAVVAAAGLLEGYPDGSFRPKGFLTRAEAATAFVRLLKLRDEGASGNTPPAAPDEVEPAIADLADPVCLAYLDEFLSSIRFEGSVGNYSYRFSAPAVAEGYKNYIDISFFDSSGKQILSEHNHWSRNAEAHTINEKIFSLNSLSQLGIAHMEIGITNLSDMNWLNYTIRWEGKASSNLRIQYKENQTETVYTEHYPNFLPEVFLWD